MREAGLVVGRTLEKLRAAVEPGMSTADLDAIAEESIRGDGATPSFKGYRGFPACICTSINDQIVHGIPSPAAVIRDGDVVSIDCGAIVDGYHGDAAITVPVGAVDEAGLRLADAAVRALAAGIAAARPGARLGDVSHAVEAVCRAGGYGIPDGLGGHGVGTAMHEDPSVPNTGRPHRGLPLREGLVIAIEPMLTEGGRSRHRTRGDGWTVATADGSRATHAEHTVAVTADGPVILTEL